MIPPFNRRTDGNVEAKNLTQKVLDKLREMMLNYEIIPGQRLTFVDLAKRFGVSRTPVNNALSILANEGFLDFIPNQGYTVHQITKEEADSLYELREIIELGSIEKTIRNITPGTLAILEKQKGLYEKAAADLGSRERFTRDQEFHASCVRFSKNVYMADYFVEVYQRLFLRYRIEGWRTERIHQALLEHNDIFQSLKMRDVKGAKASIRSHIRNGKEYIYSIIFNSSS